MLSTFGDKPILDSTCVSCGECIFRCPTGALVPKQYALPKLMIRKKGKTDGVDGHAKDIFYEADWDEALECLARVSFFN